MSRFTLHRLRTSAGALARNSVLAKWCFSAPTPAVLPRRIPTWTSVVMPFEGRSVDKSVEIRLRTNPPFPLDLLVRTPEVVRKRIEMGDCFLRDILRDGKVLYGARDG